MEVVILAAGKGTRMFSTKPKVMHTLGGRPMLHRVVEAARAVNADGVHVVIGYGAEQIKTEFPIDSSETPINWVLQEEQLGTGHAVQKAISSLNTEDPNNTVMVLYGDVPLITPETLTKLLDRADKSSLSLLTLLTANNRGLGRIIRNELNSVIAIVEERDATEQQKQITEVNSGIMAIPALKLKEWLQNLNKANNQSEYYLTDIVALAAKEGCRINPLAIDDEFEVQGVNDKTQLALLERHLQMTNNAKLLEQGVTLRDPARVDVRGELSCGKDVVIDVNVIFFIPFLVTIIF